MIDSRPGTRQLGRHHNILLLPSHKFIHVGIVSLKEEVKEKEIEGGRERERERKKRDKKQKKREKERARARARERRERGCQSKASVQCSSITPSSSF